jgi:hypothetical protein
MRTVKTSLGATANHDEVIALLAEFPLRVLVHPFASSGDDAKDGSEGAAE